jgi:hypothetical protein
MYKRVFNKIYEKYSISDANINENLKNNINFVETSLNQALNNMMEGICRDIPIGKEVFIYDQNNKIQEELQKENMELLDLLRKQYQSQEAVKNEMKKIFQENFKMKTSEILSENIINLEKNSSGIVYIEKDDEGITSPIMNFRNEDFDLEKISDKLEQNQKNVNLFLHRLYEITKPPENSSKFKIKF